MKLLAITLALAILTGCRASVLRDDLEQVEHFFEEYLKNITSAVDDQNFSLSRWIRDRIYESFSNISRRFHNLENELKKDESGHDVMEAFGLVQRILVGVAEKYYEAYSKFTRRMKHPNQEFYEALRPVAAPHTKPILEKLRKIANAFLSELQEEKKAEDGRVIPTIKEVLKRLEEFQVALQPYMDEAQAHLTKDLVSTAEALKPYLTPILKDLREYTQAVKKWARTPLFPEAQQSSSP